MTFYLSIKPFFLRFKSKINPSRPVAQWIQTWRKRLVRIHLYKKDILLCYLVYTLINSFPQHHINHAILYNQFYLPFQYDETLSIWYSRGFTRRLRFFSWLLDLVIYLKLRKQLLLLQAEKLTKWQLFSPRTILSGFCELAQPVTAILFSAWDKSRDPRVNWRTLDDM